MSQRAVFSLLAAREAGRIHRHGTDGRSWHSRPITTLVARVPLSAATPLGETVAAVPGVGEDYRYPATDVHLTIANMESVLARLSVEALAGRLADACAVEPMRRVVVSGFGVSRHTIFARVVAEPGLASLRRTVRRAVQMTQPLWRPGDSVGFVNLVRFRARHDATVIRAVRELACTDRLVWELDTLELVTTDKVLSGQGTDVIAKVPLTIHP